MTIIHRRLDTRWGPARVARQGNALTGLWFIGQKHEVPVESGWQAASDDDALIDAFEAQLREYESGERRRFDLPLAPKGSEFQQQVWQALLDIAFGDTTTYGEIARRIGRPAAVRAAGAAIGRNPLSIVIPCHRVIAGSGRLTGYAGGLDRKAALLALEREMSTAIESR